jgi:hypothetical protein
MAGVRARIFFAVAAWLLGAGAATGGSLVAVSLLGQSMAAPPTQQLTVGAVNRALANASNEPTAAAATPSAAASSHRATAAASPSVAPGPAAGGTLLTSLGGSVVAECGSSGAYLISWSPQQGYQADDVIRGPAPVARVTFMTGPSGVSMSVSCNASTPSAVTTAVHGDDDGGEPGDS